MLYKFWKNNKSNYAKKKGQSFTDTLLVVVYLSLSSITLLNTISNQYMTFFNSSSNQIDNVNANLMAVTTHNADGSTTVTATYADGSKKVTSSYSNGNTAKQTTLNPQGQTVTVMEYNATTGLLTDTQHWAYTANGYNIN